MTRRDPWYDSDNPTRVARGATWRAAVWLVAIVVGIGLISAGIWAVKVATSDVRGAGDAATQINSGANRINSQEWFHGQMAQILTADANLDQAAADKAANPGDTFYATNYTGLRNRCTEMVNNYNAEAQKISRAKWLDRTLPAHIDSADPATDCKPKDAK